MSASEPSRPFSVCVFCGARPGSEPRFLEIASRAGALLAASGACVVYGGGSVGKVARGSGAGRKERGKEAGKREGVGRLQQGARAANGAHGGEGGRGARAGEERGKGGGAWKRS